MADVNSGTLQALTRAAENVAFRDGWITSVRESLAGIGAAEAAWHPAAGERSLWEIVLHMTVWTDWCSSFLQGRDTEVTDWPPVPADTGEAAWEAVRAGLDRALDAFQDSLARLAPDRLLDRPTPEATQTDAATGVLSILLHNAYHAGQITKLRERYRQLGRA